jgi:hypothetical protein
MFGPTILDLAQIGRAIARGAERQRRKPCANSISVATFAQRPTSAIPANRIYERRRTQAACRMTVDKRGRNDVIYLPMITAADYESFHNHLRDHIPYAYEKWLKLHATWRHHHTAERNPIQNVHVNPDKFAMHLKTTGHAPDMNELLAFAEITAGGRGH